MSFLTLLSNQTNNQAIVLDQLSSTTQVFNPTVVQPGSTQTIILDLLNSTTTIYLPTITRQASNLISLDRLESTSEIYLPTIIQAGGVQTVVLNSLDSTSIITALTTDTSDILNRGIKRRRYRLTSLEEEQIAAQLLKQRQPEVKIDTKHTFDWRKLIYNAVNGITNVDELNALEIPTEGITSPSAAEAVLAELEKQKELKRLELEIKQKEAELKISEAEAKIKEREVAIANALIYQRQQLQAAKDLQQQILERHKIAQEMAMQEEMQAYLEATKAEKEYEDFKQKRDNRIKRLKALMWLAKLDL
jgi:hypothetical protein